MEAKAEGTHRQKAEGRRRRQKTQTSQGRRDGGRWHAQREGAHAPYAHHSTHNLPSTTLSPCTQNHRHSLPMASTPSSPYIDLLILSQSKWICSFIAQGIEGHGLIAWKVSIELLHKLLGEQIILLL